MCEVSNRTGRGHNKNKKIRPELQPGKNNGGFLSEILKNRPGPGLGIREMHSYGQVPVRVLVRFILVDPILVIFKEDPHEIGF